MRIAQVCRVGWPHVGGMEAVMGGLSEALVERGHEVTAFTLDETLDDGSSLIDEDIRGVPYRRLRRRGPSRYPWARGLAEAVRGYDLVHVHGLDGLADTLVRRRSVHGARVGVSTHGGYFHTGRQPWLKALWLRTITRRTLGLADAVWFTSRADQDRLADAGVDGMLLRDGVDVERFAGVTRRPEVGRWLVPGRVEAHKGLEDLLALLGQLDPTSGVHLHIVGPVRDARLERSLQTSIAALGLTSRVTIVGEVDDQGYEQQLAMCELALFPSQYEGFGVAVVEAMAAGVPVVVSPIEAFAELVTDEEDGYVFDFRAGASAHALLETVRVDHSAVSRAARQTAQEHAWGVRVKEYEQAYEALLEDS